MSEETVKLKGSRISEASNNYAPSLVSEGRSDFFTRDKIGPTRS